MKKTKLLSIFLSVCMIFTCMAGMSVSASADITRVYISGSNTVEVGSSITLTANYEGEPNGTVGYSWFVDDSRSSGAITYDSAYLQTVTITGETAGTVYVKVDLTVYDGDTISGVTGVFEVTVTEAPGTDVTITYDPGQGTGDPVIDAVQDGSVTLPGFRAGWTFPEGVNVQFIGWSINGTMYNVGDTVQVASSVTAVAQYEDIYDREFDEDPIDDDDDDDVDLPSWAEKPEYKPSGASGTAAPEEKPADEDKPADEPKDEPQDDPQDEPQDRDNDKDDVEIPNDRDTGNDGTSTVVDGSKSTNENPHTGAALGGLSLLTLAGAAMLISKKRK